ncbi:MAG: hypothetical protein K0Q63_3404 [Paenibacillus sp.]|nr:hypothetical protein [Paenibacillus sp.]
MKPGNRRYTHGANSCGDIMFLRDERGGRLLFRADDLFSRRRGLFLLLNIKEE